MGLGFGSGLRRGFEWARVWGDLELLFLPVGHLRLGVDGRAVGRLHAAVPRVIVRVRLRVRVRVRVGVGVRVRVRVRVRVC